MKVFQAKQMVRAWIEANRGQWPGLHAAHLVGGITSMPDHAPYPFNKDVDLHLVFDEGSPVLRAEGPFMNVLEVAYGGLAIEAGVKSVAEYRSADVVLCNPEIAHHLMVDSLLYDPSGLLRGLREGVRRDYPRRRWVLARIDHERHGLDGALALRPMAAARYGASGELNMLGYATTFITAVLCVATLKAPRMGSRMLLRIRQILAAYDRLDLYDELLAILGLRDVGPARVEQLLREGMEAFDLAVAVRKSPHPAQHKLHRHLRPYFVEACRSMLAEGYHREALCWLILFYLSATDVILVDGPEAEKPKFAAYQTGFLSALGMEAAATRAARYEQADRLFDRIFAVAEEIVARHPGVVD
jgi:hypothetical protein